MQRVLFAFSGGIDDVLAVHHLSRTRGHAVTAFLADIGQQAYLEPLGELALECGAAATVVVDLREAFLRRFAFPALRAGAHYENYLLATPLSRYAICEELVRYAKENHIEVLGHGASNQGNDQVRVEASIAALASEMEVLSPIRDLNFGSVDERIAHLRRHHLPERPHFLRDVSIDRNLWGCGQVHGSLADPWESPPESIYLLTRSPMDAPAEPIEVTLGFRSGVPVSLDEQELSPLALVEALNHVGGEHGIGRLDHVENGLLGGKTREVYEAPAATILYRAHQALEEIVQSRELYRYGRRAGEEYGRLVFEGLWFSELREALDRFFDSTQRYITGRVRLRLFRGRAVVTGRESHFSLYEPAASDSPERKKSLRGVSKGFVDVVRQVRKSEASHRRRPDHP
ncbi:MAG: argininosuccinate synthase [Planctomycetota bacterium]